VSTHTLPRPRRAVPAPRWLPVLHRAALDHAIADSADPFTSPRVARRCAQLIAPRSRRALAAAVDSLLAARGGRGSGLTAAIPVDRREVLGASPALAQLAARLRSEEPVAARGVVLLRALLTDGASPLYQPRRAGELDERVGAAADALEPYVPNP
jgi:hypothetical protein